MRFSLILSFRERVQMLERLIKSLKNNAYSFDGIEMLLAIDDDDIAAEKFVQNNKHTFIKYIIHKGRSEHFTKDYMNPLAKMAQGRWIIALNDDVICKTEHWDKIIWDKMARKANEVGDDMLLGLVDDGTLRPGENKWFPNFSSFPILSKESVDLMGYLFHERFRIWGVDHFIANVYRRMNRLVSLVEILLEHQSHHTKRRMPSGLDVHFDHIRDVETRFGVKLTRQMIEEEVSNITKKLKEKYGQNHQIGKGPLRTY